MTDNKRLESFREAVLGAGEKKARMIRDGAEQEASKYKKHLTDEETVSFARHKAEIEREVSITTQRENAGTELSAKRAVLLYREGLIEGLFDKARAELVKKASSPEHEEYVFACLEKIKAEYAGMEGVCFLSPAHMSLAGRIKSRFGYECKESDALTLGGVIVRFDAEGLLVDCSVSSALEKERADFAKNNGAVSV